VTKELHSVVLIFLPSSRLSNNKHTKVNVVNAKISVVVIRSSYAVEGGPGVGERRRKVS
jgi:hypothetical protein